LSAASHTHGAAMLCVRVCVSCMLPLADPNVKIVNYSVVYTSPESCKPLRTSDDGLELRLGALARVEGDVKITVTNKWGKVCAFWFHTAFLRHNKHGQVLFWKKGLDGAFKDKKHKIFAANFSGAVFAVLGRCLLCVRCS
jgi:hypothetical protein